MTEDDRDWHETRALVAQCWPQEDARRERRERFRSEAKAFIAKVLRPLSLDTYAREWLHAGLWNSLTLQDGNAVSAPQLPGGPSDELVISPPDLGRDRPLPR